MRAQEDCLTKLRTRRIRMIADGGGVWYNARDVCEALGANHKKALHWVRPEYKRLVPVEYPGRIIVEMAYVNRLGVQTIVMSRGGLSCAAVLRAVDEIAECERSRATPRYAQQGGGDALPGNA